MILAHSSAWIEFLRDAPTPAAAAVAAALADGTIAVTDPVAMEVLAGARDDRRDLELRRLLARAHRRRTRPQDYVDAARIARRCRHAGEPVRGQLDCLIAAIAIRLDVAVLAHNRDFDTIARHTALRLAPI